MKLTKVLVGLLAVSLCGAAVAVKKTRSVGVDTRPQDQLSSGELYSIFSTEVIKATPDRKVLTDLFNLIMNKTEGRGLLANSMKKALRENNTGLDYAVLESAWDKAFRAGQPLPVSKKTEDVIKKEAGKAGAWAWGVEPDLSSNDSIDAAAGDEGAFGKAWAKRATMTADQKAIFNAWLDKGLAAATSDVVKQGLEPLRIK